jgi:hypothetical protein
MLKCSTCSENLCNFNVPVGLKVLLLIACPTCNTINEFKNNWNENITWSTDNSQDSNPENSNT